MRTNNVFHRCVCLFIAVFLIVSCLTLPSYYVSAHTDPDLEAYVDYDLGLVVLTNKQGKVNSEKIELKYLKTVLDIIVSELGANDENIRENIRGLIGDLIDLSSGSAAANFANSIEDRLDSVKLKARFDVIANGGKVKGSEDKGLYERIDQPTADTFDVYTCANPSGSGCGELCPPPTIVSIYPQVGYIEVEYHDHEAVCQELVYSWWNPWAKCGKKYFTCQVCPHRASEGVFFNRTGFKAYEQLVVKTRK